VHETVAEKLSRLGCVLCDPDCEAWCEGCHERMLRSYSRLVAGIFPASYPDI